MADPKVPCKVPARPAGKREFMLNLKLKEMKKLETLNTKKLEEFRTQTVNTPWKIRGGQERKTITNHKDKDGNIVSSECDIYDDSLSGLGQAFEDTYTVPCPPKPAPTPAQ